MGKKSKNNKRIVYYISVIAVILLICSVLIFLFNGEYYDKVNLQYGKNPTVVNFSATPEFCQTIKDYDARVDCIHKNGLRPYAKSLEDCRQITEFLERTACLDRSFHITALVNSNISMCAEIFEQRIRNNCYTDFVPLYGIYACKLVEGHTPEEICYRENAVYRLNETLCQLIIDQFEIEECVANVRSFIGTKKLDLEQCAAIDTLEYQNLCFYKVFHLLGGLDNCNNTGRFEDRCVLLMKFNMAIFSRDENICLELDDEDYRQVCLRMLELPMSRMFLFDSDNDTLSDVDELSMRLNPFNPDSDGDNLMDGLEIRQHLNPAKNDTDGDDIMDDEVLKQRMEKLNIE